MSHLRFFPCLFGILACFAASTVAHVAIIGGIKAKVPYQVSVMSRNENECGGGIIGDQYILTAAHCVVWRDGRFKDVNDHLSIVAGTENIYKYNSHVKIIDIAKIFIPKEYQPQYGRSKGDIAVLKLKHSLDLQTNHYLRKIELPDENQLDMVGKTADIAGFGWTWIKIENHTEYGNNSDGHLRLTTARVVGNKDCEAEFHKQNLKYVKIFNSELCARDVLHGHAHHGVCTGDSGSPLVRHGVVIGVLNSSPYGCSEAKTASVYTRVTRYLRIIRDAMEGRENNDTVTMDLWL